MPSPTLVNSVTTGVETAAARALRWGFGQALPQFAMRTAARRGDLHGRLVLASNGPDMPLELFEEIRAAGAMHRSKFAMVTASLPVVKEVLNSHDVRSGVDFNGTGAVGTLQSWAFDRAPLGPLTPPSLLVTEPPEHTRYRKLVTRVFSVRAVQRLRGRTEEIAASLLDDLAARADSPVDLVHDYCALLPVTVIAEILGVPLSERDRVLGFGMAAAPSLDLGLTWRRFRRVDQALLGFDQWLGEHLASVRRNPGDDLLSQMVLARDYDGNGLSDNELKSTAGLVLAAGFETTVNLLSNGIALLMQNPDQLRRLQAEPDLWPNAVDEVLRVDPPVLLTGRTVVRDTEVAGQPVPRGAIITTLLAAANRDPEVFTEPNRFDVTRENAAEHVAFSSGRHYCLGAALARMEGEVGLRTIFDRFPELQLLEGAERRSTRILRGWEVLPASLKA
ncbi:cytochrome [Nocardioides sp. Soil797]|nr:cytochrome [Nocardioides sp. Soil797]